MSFRISSEQREIRAFEASIQKSKVSLDQQRFEIEREPESFCQRVATIVVKISNFKKSHPNYVVPKSFAMRMCIHKLAGKCSYEGDNPCLNPHNYALRRAAVYIESRIDKNAKRVSCKTEECRFGERCKFLHNDDIIIGRYIQEIAEQKLSKKKMSSDTWITVGKEKNALSRAKAEKMAASAERDLLNNPYSQLANEIEEETDSPGSQESSEEAFAAASPSVVAPDESENSDDEQLPETVQSVFDAVFFG